LTLLCSLCFSPHATPSSAIVTLSLHDALPISQRHVQWDGVRRPRAAGRGGGRGVRRSADHADRHEDRQERHPRGAVRRPAVEQRDRKSTRLNSSHQIISYAVFCLKKKKNK